jgi:addiction module HigA family antidote
MNNRKRRPTHPGAILREDILPQLDMSQAEIARALGVTPQTVGEIMRERRGISPDMANRLAKAFNTTPEFWVRLQEAVDMWDAVDIHQKEYDQIPKLAAAATA